MNEVRAKILAVCGPALAARGIDPAAAPADLDLRAVGAIDSLGFIELIAELEDEFGVELEVEALSAEEITVLGPLSAHVADQIGVRR